MTTNLKSNSPIEDWLATNPHIEIRIFKGATWPDKVTACVTAGHEAVISGNSVQFNAYGDTVSDVLDVVVRRLAEELA